MSDDPKQKFRKAAEKIDIDLGGLLGNLGEVLGEAVQRLSQAGEAAVDKMTEAQSDKGPIRTHTGLRVRVGGLSTRPEKGPAAAKPVNPDRAKPAPQARPLDCDLVEDGGAWIVTAEMPGVSPEELRLSTQGTTLVIETTGARSYRGEVTLPAPCPAESISSHLVNGILTLRPGGPA